MIESDVDTAIKPLISQYKKGLEDQLWILEKVLP